MNEFLVSALNALNRPIEPQFVAVAVAALVLLAVAVNFLLRGR